MEILLHFFFLQIVLTLSLSIFAHKLHAPSLEQTVLIHVLALAEFATNAFNSVCFQVAVLLRTATKCTKN